MAPLDGFEKDYAAPVPAPVREVPEVFSVEGLRDWLETRDPAEAYDWWSKDDCAACRYLKARGYTAGVQGVGGVGAQDNYLRLERAMEAMHVEFMGVFATRPFTMGAALSRCESYLTPQGR